TIHQTEIEGTNPPWEIRQVTASEYLASQPLGRVNLRSASRGFLPEEDLLGPGSGGASGPNLADRTTPSISLRAAAWVAGTHKNSTLLPAMLRTAPIVSCSKPNALPFPTMKKPSGSLPIPIVLTHCRCGKRSGSFLANSASASALLGAAPRYRMANTESFCLSSLTKRRTSRIVPSSFQPSGSVAWRLRTLPGSKASFLVLGSGLGSGGASGPASLRA